MRRIVFLLFLGSLLVLPVGTVASGQKAVHKRLPVQSRSLKPAQVQPKPTLEGKWCNQLGSDMELFVNGNDVTGRYRTAVGKASQYYEIRGRRVINNDGSQVVGFVVGWQNETGNSHSATTWCGQLQMIDGQETLTTLWLLTSHTAPKDNWEAVQINKDVFTRCK